MREMFCKKSRNIITEIHQWLSVHLAVNISYISLRHLHHFLGPQNGQNCVDLVKGKLFEFLLIFMINKI